MMADVPASLPRRAVRLDHESGQCGGWGEYGHAKDIYAVGNGGATVHAVIQRLVAAHNVGFL